MAAHRVRNGRRPELGSATTVAPAESGTFMTPDIPPEWYIGIAASEVSSPGANAYQSAN